ncbi:ACP S-malonyltransferase [Helicovermis profundi]|uniref:Malonyl CoA-acyl carrier protein transacylase n=1 Tax=Helicovermis profundi TaxID=3065157 RepID=A0AAU9ESH9_9FIRM|nr:ACP S-malonyltransferase [Clostridia bacterium S502]
MKKVAFVFPGQGAQYVGMGEELVEKYEIASKVFDEASDSIGYDMKKLCFSSTEDELKKTENTQPSILTTSFAIYKVLEEKGFKPHAVAGLSLGEYSALVASGAIDFKESVKIVQKRGKFMQEEVPEGIGGMAAILGLSNEKVIEACDNSREHGVVEPANFNCPKQLVIAGEIEAVKKAGELCKEYGAKKVVMLPVSAPFHTSLLKGAGEKLAKELDGININKLSIPLVANYDAKFLESHNDIKEKLIKQVSNPVKWEESINNMINNGINVFVQVGPGNALTKFIKKVSKEVSVLNVENISSLEKTISILENINSFEKTINISEEIA